MKYNPGLLFPQFLLAALSNLVDVDEFLSFELAANEQILAGKITKIAEEHFIRFFLLAVVLVSVINDLEL